MHNPNREAKPKIQIILHSQGFQLFYMWLQKIEYVIQLLIDLPSLLIHFIIIFEHLTYL